MSATALTAPTGDTMTRPGSSQSATTARALLSFAKCFGARDHHEVYLSAPITTGEAYVRWQHTSGAQITRDHPSYESLHYEHVISTNLTRVAPLVAHLRKSFSDRLVIDPTSLDDIPGWSQRDYHDFWCGLIEKYVALVIFADGWQFSTGCVREFATAMHTDKKVFDQSLRPLTLQGGLRLIVDAIAQFDSLHVDSTSLRRALGAAEQAATAS